MPLRDRYWLGFAAALAVASVALAALGPATTSAPATTAGTSSAPRSSANIPVASSAANTGARGTNGYANQVTIVLSGEYRFITSNGIPNHATGPFPNAHNPNSISPQQHYFRVPLHPVVAAQPTPFGLGRFGVALNGVPFEAAGAEYWNGNPNSGWQYEVMGGHLDLGLDVNNAHVQPTGSYHYHGLPTGYITPFAALTSQKMILLGYAADGFPIYNQYGHTDPKDSKSPPKKLKPSFALKKGARPVGSPGGNYDGTFTADFQYVAGSGDLDECNGRFEVTPDYPEGIYHYTLSESFPYIPRSFRGTPDATFIPPGGGGPPPGGGLRRGPPPGPLGPPPPRGAPPPPYGP